jgi:hypothetical protein
MNIFFFEIATRKQATYTTSLNIKANYTKEKQSKKSVLFRVKLSRFFPLVLILKGKYC